MFELFANPLNLMIGGALISSPIIIHLINRMRYKRIRWAAMEFLLKSQKRNRRRLIIEQLILLALRCSLVALAGLLLARFLGASFAEFRPQNTVHLVLLDDRLSMSDQWKQEDGTKRNAFQAGKQLIEKEIAKNALLNRSAQRLVLLRLSELSHWADQQKKEASAEVTIPSVFDQRLSEDSLRDLSAVLAKLDECSQLHLDLYKGVEAAKTILGKHGTDQRVLYVVSDFRQRHWFEPEATLLLKDLESLASANVKVQLVDTADPKRSEHQKVPLHHDNLAVVDLRPESRVAAQNSLVQFKMAVANFGAGERKNVRVTVKVNGGEHAEASQTLPSVPPGKPTEATFLLTFGELGYNRITANLENEDYGIPGDNVRYTVLEVRKQVPVLVIDGDLSTGDKPGGDTFHLRTLLNAARGYEVVRGSVADLERPNLAQYASVYLLNVEKLNNKNQLEKLTEYVREGGGVAFFLGDRVQPRYYNDSLYADGKGVFPAVLANEPSRALNDEQRQEKLLQNLADPQPQVYVRDETHPIFENTEIAKYRDAFNFLTIARYFPVPRQRWNRDSSVQELMTLPNTRLVGDYEERTIRILEKLQGPIEDSKYVKYRPGLELHRKNIRDKLGGKSLAALATALRVLLIDGGIPGNPDRPSMKEFWEQTDPTIAKLREEIDRFRETVQLGDPLLVAKEFGKGRTVAVMTTAGLRWNDWAGGGPASFTYPMIMLEMQKYLSSLGSEGSLTVDTPRTFDLDGSRYESAMRWHYLPEAQAEDKSAGASQSGVETNGRLRFEFDQALKPGIYKFEFTQKGADAAGQPRTETRAFAFNVDTAGESDLRRASKTELERIAPTNVKLHAVGSGLGNDVSDHKNDLSETAWLYLLFLIILVAEQALAVHLSFHLKGNEAAPPAQAVRPTATAA
jgi:hypothetical protein